MKILEQYLYAIKRKLPKKGSDEVILELRSLLMDNIENTYGEHATEAEVKSIISDFGPPTEVAKEYGGNIYIIAPEFTDIYKIIIKIVVACLFGAFVIAYVVQVISGSADSNIAMQGLKVLSNTFTASISSVGMITLIFMIISKYVDGDELDIAKDWTPDDLPELPEDNEKVSMAESIAGIVFTTLAIVLFNAFPQIIEGFIEFVDNTGIDWGHTLVVDRFFSYIRILSVVWVIEICYSILTLIYGRITKPIRAVHLLTLSANFFITLLMFRDTSLYIGEMNLIGFRAILLITLIFGPIDFLSNVFKMLKPSN